VPCTASRLRTWHVETSARSAARASRPAGRGGYPGGGSWGSDHLYGGMDQSREYAAGPNGSMGGMANGAGAGMMQGAAGGMPPPGGMMPGGAGGGGMMGAGGGAGMMGGPGGMMQQQHGGMGYGGHPGGGGGLNGMMGGGGMMGGMGGGGMGGPGGGMMSHDGGRMMAHEGGGGVRPFTAVKLRGLPFGVREDEVRAFLVRYHQGIGSLFEALVWQGSTVAVAGLSMGCHSGDGGPACILGRFAQAHDFLHREHGAVCFHARPAIRSAAGLGLRSSSIEGEMARTC